MKITLITCRLCYTFSSFLETESFIILAYLNDKRVSNTDHKLLKWMLAKTLSQICSWWNFEDSNGRSFFFLYIDLFKVNL